MIAIDWQKQRYVVGVQEMDETHAEFAALVNAISVTNDDGDTKFLLRRLVEHTKEHFAREEELMKACSFPAMEEHKSEHARVLGDLSRFESMAARGMSEMAKAFVIDFLPQWFEQHVQTMDSALANCLKQNAAKTGRKGR